jgi:hypothetical protein
MQGRQIRNAWVGGSNPLRGTSFSSVSPALSHRPTHPAWAEGSSPSVLRRPTRSWGQLSMIRKTGTPIFRKDHASLVMEPTVAPLRRSLRARRFRRWYIFALASVVADSVAQRSNRYSQQVRGPGPVPPMRSQRLQNELALNKRQPVTDQLLDAVAVDCRKSALRCRVDGRTLRRLKRSIVWHHHLH